MIYTGLVDGYGSGGKLKINGEGEIAVVVHQHPPIDEARVALPFRQRFTDSGVVDGSDDMAVDGSFDEVPFYIEALPDFDVYICSISAIIGDGGSPALNKFGSLNALTNGVCWEWSSLAQGTIVLHEGIKTNLEFVRTGFATPAIGSGTEAFLADVSGGGSEKSYIPQIDLKQQFGLPWGLRLRRGTTERLSFIVRDDLQGLTTMNIIAYGARI
jgi:hypothetical protein